MESTPAFIITAIYVQYARYAPRSEKSANVLASYVKLFNLVSYRLVLSESKITVLLTYSCVTLHKKVDHFREISTEVLYTG